MNVWSELGILALIGSLFASVLLVAVPTAGVLRHDQQLMTCAKYYAVWQWVLGAIAFVILDICFLLNDFSLVYVRANSSLVLPWYYKICALWGGHEGSMLLWLCLLQTWTLAVAMGSRSLEPLMRARLLVVMGLLSTGFLLFILLTSNPFVQVFLNYKTIGRDLNPLLQDPGFLFHPPMLYMGYVGFSVAFAFAIATLWAGEFNQAFARWVRPWILFAWCCLTLGITLGSWWAYRELGWGGFWFWDPVENASFMPWLVGTALIHALLVAEKRRALVAWVILLSVIVFSLSLVGTFLVRSGVLTSVHAFAVDPLRGTAILIMLGFVIGGSLLMYAYRAHHMISPVPIAFFSREMTLLLNNIFLVIAMFTVLLGTLYPLMIDALGLGKISVGAPYFNTVFVPMLLPFLFLLGLSAFMPWGEVKPSFLWSRVWQSLLATFIVLLIGLLLYFSVGLLTWLSIAFSFWIVVTACQAIYSQGRKTGFRQIHLSRWAMMLSHIGVAVSVVGIAVSTGFGRQADEVLTLNVPKPFGVYEVVLERLDTLQGPNYHGVRASVKVYNANSAKYIYPEKRIYEVGNVPMTDAAIDVSVFKDIYVALGEPIDNNTWRVRLYDKPLVRWIWIGGLMMCLGGGLACLNILVRRRK